MIDKVELKSIQQHDNLLYGSPWENQRILEYCIPPQAVINMWWHHLEKPKPPRKRIACMMTSNKPPCKYQDCDLRDS